MDGEYRIVAAECGHENDPYVLAPTFLEACRGRKSIEDLWDEEFDYMRPRCPTCFEDLVCPTCGKRGPIRR